MTNDGKENIRHTTCTNHTTRYDKDLFRVCPTKLNKRELEDLYFSLLENNTQLKKTINGQRDQIKLLTTKVNRMTGQKNALGNLSKDCCASTKAIINEQKETIADLKIANERLSDRIRLLNMRLCSAKQFLKRSPGQTTTRCTKCSITPNQSVKNSSVCVLNTRGSEANLQSHTEAGSSQFLNKESSTIKADVTQASQTEMKDEACQQNKCRTLMNELKQKIDNLEEDLSKTHEQYSERISKLEELISELRIENTRLRALHVESHHRLEFEEKKAGEMLRKLRDRELQCDNLATELQIEKGKVSELETQVKAADISSQIAEALENHLKNNMTKHRSSMVQSKTELSTLGLCASDRNCSPPMAVSNNSEMLKIGEPDEEKTVSKNSDDSGYAEKLDDKKECPKPDQNILDQIANLQAQLHKFKLSIKDNETSDDLKNVMVDSLQKSKLESNEIGEDAKNVNIPKQSKKNNTSDTSFEKHFTKNCNIVHDGDENSISIVKNIYDSNKMANHNNKEEISIENDNEKKRRRSSLLCTNQAEAKDLSVSYDKNKIIVGSSINIVDNKGTQGNYNGKDIRATCKSDSDSSVENKVSERNLKKKILSKKAKDTASRHASLNVSVLEKECDLNIDNNDKEEVKLATPNTKENVESPVNTSSGNSTYTVEGKPAQSKLTKDATYPIENKLEGATFQADTHLAPTNNLTAKQSRVPQPMKTSTPKKHKTYKAEGSDEVTRSSSPDNTDNEISSLTDLPNEDKSLRDYISPGEEKVTSTFSDSYADATTTDYGSLSLGEVPISGDSSARDYRYGYKSRLFPSRAPKNPRRTRRKRNKQQLMMPKKFAEVETKDKPTDSIEPSTTTNKMEEALHAIDEELTRCRELLRGQPPARVIPDLLFDYRGSRPYS